MTIADFLTFVGIVVSIVFGFIITHFYSIRDTRTRVLKDYYIEQVKNIKGRVDHFFHKLAFGKGSFKKVVSWYNHLSIDVMGIDCGIRKSLDLQIHELITMIDKFYGEITKWEDFNNQYSKSNYLPDTVHRQRLLEMKLEIDEFLNDYINHINQSNNYPVWKIQFRRIKQSYKYYSEKKYKFPCLCSIWERFEKHIWESLITIFVLLSSFHCLINVEFNTNDDLATPLNNISEKQELIYQELNMFRNKYKPINVEYNISKQSSNLNADMVDSVNVELLHTKHDK